MLTYPLFTVVFRVLTHTEGRKHDFKTFEMKNVFAIILKELYIQIKILN